MSPAHPPDYLPDLLQQIQAIEGDRPSTVSLLIAAAQEHAQDARPLLLLGAELIHAGALDQGEAALVEALRRDSTFAIARFQLGLLQVTRDRPDDARATWAPLDDLDTNDPLRLFKTGLELLVQGRPAEARPWLERGIEHNQSNQPLNRDMRMVLGQVDAMTSGGSPPASPETPQDHFLISSYRKSS